MHILDLPYDVWTNILRIASKQDVLHFGRANHMAYDMTIPAILSDVTLHSEFSRLSFKDVTTPRHHIRSLTICRSAFNVGPDGTPLHVDYAVCALLADAISYAQNLRRIRIERLETLLEKTPSLAVAIIGFQRLESVAFEGVGSLSLSLIENLQSTPRSVQLRCLRNPQKLSFTDLLNSLKGLVGHLEFLSLNDYAGVTLDDYPTVWEFVHILELIPSHPSPPSPLPSQALPALVRAFPNVRIAHLGNFDRYWAPRFVLPGWALRHRPVDWSIPRPSPSPSSRDIRPVRWPALDILQIYALPSFLVAPLRELRYHKRIDKFESADAVSKDLEAIRRLAPAVLSVRMRGVPTEYLSGLPGSMESVRFLQLWQDSSPRGCAGLRDSLPALLYPMLENMTQLPLLGLSIGHDIRWQETTEDTDLFREIATTIVRKCPSVRFVGFYRTLGGDVPYESMRWYRAHPWSDNGSFIVDVIPRCEVPGVVSYLEGLDRNAD